MYDLGPVAVAS